MGGIRGKVVMVELSIYFGLYFLKFRLEYEVLLPRFFLCVYSCFLDSVKYRISFLLNTYSNIRMEGSGKVRALYKVLVIYLFF